MSEREAHGDQALFWLGKLVRGPVRGEEGWDGGQGNVEDGIVD